MHRHCDIAPHFTCLKTLFRLVVVSCLVTPGSLAEVSAQDGSDNAASLGQEAETAVHQSLNVTETINCP